MISANDAERISEEMVSLNREQELKITMSLIELEIERAIDKGIFRTKYVLGMDSIFNKTVIEELEDFGYSAFIEDFSDNGPLLSIGWKSLTEKE